MASYESIFPHIQIVGNTEIRTMDQEEWGESNFRLAIRDEVITIQRRSLGADGSDVWLDIETFTEIQFAAMVAFDRYLHEDGGYSHIREDDRHLLCGPGDG